MVAKVVAATAMRTEAPTEGQEKDGELLCVVEALVVEILVLVEVDRRVGEVDSGESGSKEDTNRGEKDEKVRRLLDEAATVAVEAVKPSDL